MADPLAEAGGFGLKKRRVSADGKALAEGIEDQRHVQPAALARG